MTRKTKSEEAPPVTGGLEKAVRRLPLAKQRRAGKREAADTASSVRQAEELMELAVDAAQSRQLPEFLQRFAGRAARMLNAKWGGVAVFRGRETDLYSA